MTRGAAFVAALVLAMGGTAWASPGDLDPTFGDGGVASLPDDEDQDVFYSVTLDSAGRYVAVGSSAATSDADTSSLLVARFDSDGALDDSFGDAGRSTVALDGFGFPIGAAVAPNGSVAVLAFVFGADGSSLEIEAVRLTSTGAPDVAFGDGGTVELASDAGGFPPAFPGGIVIDSSTVTVLMTSISEVDFTITTELWRFTATGQPDASFGDDGVVTLPTSAGALGSLFSASALHAVDGGLLIGLGDESGPVLLRTDLAGNLDESFGDEGVVHLGEATGTITSIAVDDADGILAAAQTDTSIVLARLTADGALDVDFGAGGLRSLDGDVGDVLAGAYVLGFDDARPLLLLQGYDDDFVQSAKIHRLLPDGARDDAFGDHGRLAIDDVVPFTFQALGSGVLDGERAVLSGAELVDDTDGGQVEAKLIGIEMGGPSRAPAPAVVSRIAGEDRIATAIAASTDAFGDHESADDDRRPAEAVVLASSTSFADALVGGPLAAARNAPLLLTGHDRLDDRVAAELHRVLGSTGEVLVLGGSGALDGQVDQDLERLGYAVSRCAGHDRYETAEKVADAASEYTLGETAFLATGRDYPDALAAGAAAVHAGGIVLLTDGPTMRASTRQYLDEGFFVSSYAIGGDAAQAAPEAEAIAGADRYETARLVAERFFLTPELAGVASGAGFADALSGGLHASLNHGPLVLSPPASLGPDASAYLHDHGRFVERVVLYGGTAALSPAVESGAAASVS